MKNQVAQTILNQLGGNKFIAMTGAKQLTAHEHGLSFRIGRNATATNHVAIALDADDTYSIMFSKISISRKTYEVKQKTIKAAGGVYCDQLQEIFTSVTGMYTSL